MAEWHVASIPPQTKLKFSKIEQAVFCGQSQKIIHETYLRERVFRNSRFILHHELFFISVFRTCFLIKPKAIQLLIIFRYFCSILRLLYLFIFVVSSFSSSIKCTRSSSTSSFYILAVLSILLSCLLFDLCFLIIIFLLILPILILPRCTRFVFPPILSRNLTQAFH